MGDFDAWLDEEPPAPIEPVRRHKGPGFKSPYSMDPSTPYVRLDKHFDTYDPETGQKVRIEEVIAFIGPDEGREYRGYGGVYLTNGKSLSKRSKAQFVRLEPRLIPPQAIKEIDSQW